MGTRRARLKPNDSDAGAFGRSGSRTALAIALGGVFLALAIGACGDDSTSTSSTGSASATSTTGGGESNQDRAGRELCERYCGCYPDHCKAGETAPTDCHEEAQEPTGKGEACDDAKAQQLDCATAAIAGCPPGSDFEQKYISCAPPQEEQEMACGPGGIPG